MRGGKTDLARLDVLQVHALLRRHFHVDDDVVSRGFRGVDGSTLGYYEEADFTAAGVASKPLARRLQREIADFRAGGVPDALVESLTTATHVDAPAPTKTPVALVEAEAPAAAEAKVKAPAVAEAKAQSPLRPDEVKHVPAMSKAASARPNVQGKPLAIDTAAAPPERPVHPNAIGRRRVRSLSERFRQTSDRQIAALSDAAPAVLSRDGSGSQSLRGRSLDERVEAPGPPPHRRSGDWSFTSFSRRLLVGAPAEPLPNKLEVRLEGELRRYSRAEDLPRQIESLEPSELGKAAFNTSASEHVRWVARVKVDDTAPREEVHVAIPAQYPFEGPTVLFRGREVRFVMGDAAKKTNAGPTVLHAGWTPAQNIADAVLGTLGIVDRVEYEEEVLRQTGAVLAGFEPPPHRTPRA